MLYLAEVQKQSNKFGLGGGRTELKLLACQRGENNWSAVSGDEVVLAEDATNFLEQLQNLASRQSESDPVT
ncbi:MAG: hypothetical protein U1O81_06130, partial [Planktothrix rubescens PR223]